MNKIIKQEEFNELLKTNKTIIVKFYADWCGPCKMFAPIFEAASKKASSVNFVTINVDELEEISKKYKITSIPTIVLFKNSAEVKRYTGIMQEPDLLEFIK